MEHSALFKCLSDDTRLRILNLLMQGPLCVCHVQGALEEPQAKASKQLAYMKRLGLLVSRRRFNWTIYEISSDADALRDEVLRSLAEQVFSGVSFLEDVNRLKEMDTSVACEPDSMGVGVSKVLPVDGSVVRISK